MSIELLSVIISIVSVTFAAISFFYSIKNETRTDKLYQTQRISKIQVTPISFVTYNVNGSKMGKLTVEISNYTGFHAYDVYVDAIWDIHWIYEWVGVAYRGLEKMKENGPLTEDQENQLKHYKEIVSSGHSFDIQPNGTAKDIIFQGSFSETNKMIIIRIKWKSENNAHFDKYYKYNLVITKDYTAESFILIPENNMDEDE